MKIKVFKYDPAVDAAPYYKEYEVPYKDKMTALEALVYVHENFEEVAYDYSCHGRMCGRCAMMLNGVPVMMCAEPLAADKDYTIEPLAGFPVIRDMIIDRSQFEDRLAKRYVRVRVEPLDAETVNNFDVSKTEMLYGLEWCSRCGICQAGCPVVNQMPDKYAGPAFMVAEAYRMLDSYDQADRALAAVDAGLYRCIGCGLCDQVCPQKDIKHLEVFAKMRAAAEAKGYKPSYAK